MNIDTGYNTMYLIQQYIPGLSALTLCHMAMRNVLGWKSMAALILQKEIEVKLDDFVVK